jgi:transcriptional regulator with XRE-family HTH domain
MTKGKLTEQQYRAIEELNKLSKERKTMQEIAEICGVDRTTLWRWTKDETFIRERKLDALRNSLNDLPDVLKSTADAAKEGNAAAQKNFFQIHDMVPERLTVEHKDEGKSADIEELKRLLDDVDA